MEDCIKQEEIRSGDAVVDTADAGVDADVIPTAVSSSPPAKKQKTTADNDNDDDDKIKKIKKSCPIQWTRSDNDCGGFCEIEHDANFCLSVGWEKDPGEEGLVEHCLEYVDPKSKGGNARVDEEKFDSKGAEKALRKDGGIEDIFKFAPEHAEGGTPSWPMCWTVNYHYKKTLTKKKASVLLESLFDGRLCPFPEEYEPGRPPFGDPEEEEEEEEEEEDESDSSKAGGGKLKLLHNLKESVMTILDKAGYVAHSSWTGHCEGTATRGHGNADIDRQDFFFFSTEDDEKFLLQFEWSYYRA